MLSPNAWDIFKPEDSVWYCWHMNGAAAFLRKDGEMWRIAFKTIPFCERNDNFGGPIAENPPDELLAATESPITCIWAKGNMVLPHPYFGDLPYQFKFREKIKIAPGEKAHFTAVFPPLVKFELSKEIVLAEAMPLIPQPAFFGPDTMSGQFGYFLNDALLPKQAEETAATSVLVRCDIRIKNSTKTMIERECLTLWPETLNLYVYENQLIADTVEFEILAAEEKFHIHHIKNNGYRLLNAGVKSGAGEIFVRNSVGFIKHITKGGI